MQRIAYSRPNRVSKCRTFLEVVAGESKRARTARMREGYIHPCLLGRKDDNNYKNYQCRNYGN